MGKENLLARCEAFEERGRTDRVNGSAVPASCISGVLKIVLASSCFRLVHVSLISDVADFLPFLCVSFLTFAAVLYVVLFKPSASAVNHPHMSCVLHLVQLYMLTLAMWIYPSCKEILAMKSTIIFCVFELPNYNADWAVFALLARQFFMWHIPLIATGEEIHSGWFYATFAGAAAALLMYLTKELQRIRRDSCRCDRNPGVRNTASLDKVAAGVMMVTADKRVRYYNSQAAAIFACVSSTQDVECFLSQLPCSLEIDPEDAASVPLLEKILLFIDSSTKVQPLGVTQISGKYFEWHASRCMWGQLQACTVTAVDITPWAKAILALKRENKSKSELLRFVSHELRTPANAILNLSSNVRSADNLLSEQKLELSMVVTSTYFLLSVVNDLLDLTRIAAEKFILVKRSFDIRKEVKEAVSLVELQCARKGLSLAVKFDDYVPETIFSDPTRLKQVLLNLLGNALKFTFHGGIQAICLLTDRNTLKITVKDSGIGVAKEKIAGLCQAFATIEGTQQINPQGCGLGLYISNILAISLGSKPIEIQSKVGIGSEFSFEVNMFQQELVLKPGVEDATTDIEDERDCESSVSTPSFIGGISACCEPIPGILVVDDSDFNRVVLLKMLESLHLLADEATSGLRALTMIRSNLRKGHTYRLILMDIEMPEMDGLAATQEIRAMEQIGELSQRTRIIACSAHRGPEDAERFRRAGMDDSMEKPISIARLRELLEIL